MKRPITSALLAAALSLSLVVPAGAVSSSTAVEAIQALGIITGDSSGDLNLSSPVTRAEFVTMMTAASSYKDSIGEGSGVSLFKDVKSDHWASEYIKLAVEQGWMSGYVDGTFRPDNQITLEEACTALLKMLGYDSSTLAGSYPSAQLSKASSVGLRDDVDAVQGEALTRQDCVMLFYNLLVSDDSSGTVYGTTLGYTVTNGEVDYSTLVTADTKGPYVASADKSLSLPFSTSGATIYRNGALSSLSAVQEYDVYYYNENLRTVWVYSDKVSGTLTALSPSSAAPTSITVAGTEYELGTSTAIYKCSSQGEFSTGDVVTLLLGMNGEVVDVVSIESAQSIYYGVVLSSKKGSSSSSTSSSDTSSIQTTTQVVCSDGTVRTFYTSGGPYSVGRLVSVTLDSSGTTIKSMQSKSLSGKVSSDGSSFAGYDFADDVEILDTDGEGGYARIYPSRLAGETLQSDDVIYYTLNSSDEIDCLILSEATGDTYTYVYVTSAETSSSGTSVSGSYEYYQNGEQYTVNGSVIYTAKTGGAALIYEDEELKNIRQLEDITITDLDALSLTATSGNRSYDIAEDVQVLLRDTNGSRGHYLTTLSEIDSSNYTLKGWYDDLGCSAGGRIRIIVATPEEYKNGLRPLHFPESRIGSSLLKQRSARGILRGPISKSL